MRSPSFVQCLGILLTAGVLVTPMPASGQPLCTDFGYGNGGYAAGYSMVVGRRCGWGYGVGPICRPRLACWRPCWNPCWRPYRAFCGVPGFGFGVPGCGFGGWSGYSSFYGTQSVYLAAPYGGATFFSGGIVPYPVPYAVPYVVPYAVPTIAPWPWFGAVTSPPGAAQVQGLAVAPTATPPLVRATTPRGPATVARVSPSAALRAAHPASRRRAADLVATGDRQLREAGGDGRRLKAAAEAYRRAAAAAADDPDIHIRHAIALMAAGRPADADAAARRAVALDGRLGAQPGDHGPDEPQPLVARGATILREIAAGNAEAVEPMARLAAAWAERGAGPLARLAAVSGDR